jgi:uncharacterized protein (DUF305 family)
MHKHAQAHYINLGMMTVLSFLSMYALMYAMVDRFGNVYSSLDQVYMAGLMTAPMVPIEMALMWPMYINKKLNAALIALALVALVGFFAAIRYQAAVGDKQFLRAMIPHHAGAILMCREAKLQDDQIKDLCRRIIASQQKEIDEMTARLKELSG